MDEPARGGKRQLFSAAKNWGEAWNAAGHHDDGAPW